MFRDVGLHSILLTINVLQKRFIFQWAPLVFYDFSIYIRDFHDFSYNTSTFYNYIYTNFTNKILYMLDNINVKQLTNNYEDLFKEYKKYSQNIQRW